MSIPPASEGGAEVAAAGAGIATPSVGLHGTVALFNATQKECSEYAERLELYFIANDIILVAKRWAILLGALSLFHLSRPFPGPYQRAN